MTISRFSLLCVGLLAGVLPAASQPAASQDGNGQLGTVNYFTPAQKARAFNAATHAGYRPTLVEMFQDGNFFLTASKGGQTYELTVVPSGQVYASAPVEPVS